MKLSNIMVLKYGDCFSGMSCPAFALKQLGIDFEYKFACDIDRYCRTFLQNEHNPEMIYSDVKDIESLPKVDLYVAGFPCQPFSSANTLIKTENHKSVDLFDEAFRCLKLCDPEVFILENVRGLTFKKNASYFKKVLDALSTLTGYHISYQILNSKDLGLPQSRNRIWFIGSKTTVPRFPESVPLTKSIWNILDLTLPMKPLVTRCKSFVDQKFENGKYYIDNCQSMGAFWRIYDQSTLHCHCITASNVPRVYFKENDQVFYRFYTNGELKELFGLKTPLTIQYLKLSKLLGNGMDINVLEKLISLNF